MPNLIYIYDSLGVSEIGDSFVYNYNLFEQQRNNECCNEVYVWYC
jgi:hypothetical protein